MIELVIIQELFMMEPTLMVMTEELVASLTHHTMQVIMFMIMVMEVLMTPLEAMQLLVVLLLQSSIPSKEPLVLRQLL